MAAEKRQHVHKLRLSQAEHEAMLARAGDQPLAVWLRQLGLGGTAPPPPRPRKPEREIPPAVAELTRAVVLLTNQLAQRDPPPDQALLDALRRIDTDFNKALEITGC